MTAESDVRDASRQFYAALNRMANGDSSQMAGVWSHGAHVTAMHPIGGREQGWDAVGGSFANVAQIASEGTIGLKDQHIQVMGDVAYETGVEEGEVKLGGMQTRIDHRVTNIYERQEGTWKMVHHHTDLSPAMLEVLKQLPE